MSQTGTPLPFLVWFGVLLCAGAAWSAGQALAQAWRPVWYVFPVAILLTLAERFLAFALFGAMLLSVLAALTSFIAASALGLVAYRVRLAAKMVTQYPWLYQRAGPFGWRDMPDSSPDQSIVSMKE